MRIAIVLAGVLLAAGCRASLEGAPCPCLSGYECNPQNVCVLITGGGPGIDGSSQGDAGGGDPDGGAGLPDASADGGGEFPDAADFPDSGGGAPDAGGGADAGVAVWYEQ